MFFLLISIFFPFAKMNNDKSIKLNNKNENQTENHQNREFINSNDDETNKEFVFFANLKKDKSIKEEINVDDNSSIQNKDNEKNETTNLSDKNVLDFINKLIQNKENETFINEKSKIIENLKKMNQDLEEKHMNLNDIINEALSKNLYKELHNKPKHNFKNNIGKNFFLIIK